MSYLTIGDSEGVVRFINLDKTISISVRASDGEQTVVHIATVDGRFTINRPSGSSFAETLSLISGAIK